MTDIYSSIAQRLSRSGRCRLTLVRATYIGQHRTVNTEHAACWFRRIIIGIWRSCCSDLLLRTCHQQNAAGLHPSRPLEILSVSSVLALATVW
jgi:hypothetical protein